MQPGKVFLCLTAWPPPDRLHHFSSMKTLLSAAQYTHQPAKANHVKIPKASYSQLFITENQAINLDMKKLLNLHVTGIRAGVRGNHRKLCCLSELTNVH